MNAGDDDARVRPRAPSPPLAGRVVLVTGAGRGIGRGVCQAAVEAGALVVATDLDAKAAEATAALVREAGGEAHALPLDVTDESSIRVAFTETATRFDRLDGLVNNAGALVMGPALETSAEAWRMQFAVNVDGLFACCRAAAERMRGQPGGGAIVNIASNAGKVGYPNMAAYNAAKAAVISLTRSLAAEWAEHAINVNAVCPGGVDTPMLRGVAEWVAGRTGGDPDDILASMPPAQLGRLIQPVEVGRVVAFLLSDGARIIRGQSINVDGGDTPY